MILRISTVALAATASLSAQISFDHLATIRPANAAGEIGAFDAGSSRFFVTNPVAARLDVYALSATGRLAFVQAIPLSGAPNSVAVKNGLVAVAVEGATGQDLGAVQFFDAATGLPNGAAVTVGALPDMLTFTPDGLKILTANEGEADTATGLINPEGSVSIVDVATRTAQTASFAPFNPQKAALQLSGVRLSNVNGVSLAQDVEPEYLTIDPTGSTAWVTLQEANSIAVVDIASATITAILPLGEKDHNLPQNAFDPSNADGINGNFQNFPILGLYMPDAITSFTIDGVTYLATANEGDSRADFPGFEDEVRGRDLEAAFNLDTEDPTPDTGLYTSAQLNTNAVLGRLNFVTGDYDLARGDTDGDGDVDQLYSFGARSFSIWTTAGVQVFDSGSQFEQQMLLRGLWDDSRSDDKGPEPEAVTFGVVDGTPLLFIGLERTHAVMVYEVSNPSAPTLVDVIDVATASTTTVGTTTLRSTRPEGLEFIPANANPTGRALLAVVSEGDGGLSVFAIQTGDAVASTFGAGCPAASPLTLASNLPVLGGSWTLSASNVPTGAPFCAFWFGEQAPPVAIDLGPFGFAGCSAYVESELAVVAAPVVAQASTNVVAVPAAPALIGFVLTAQASTFDGVTFASSNGLVVVAGN